MPLQVRKDPVQALVVIHARVLIVRFTGLAGTVIRLTSLLDYLPAEQRAACSPELNRFLHRQYLPEKLASLRSLLVAAPHADSY